ncbi:MAG: alpha/beta hydrolase, partial [Eubacterium sp.]|nr:alpha/beta hydrolase [Eubacterium sp.]
MKKESFHMPATDGIHTLHGIIWKPTSRPVIGILQVSHGMTEWAERYERLARFMVSHGFVVVANEHLGHGGTAQKDYGYFVEKNPDLHLIRDLHR